MAKRSKKCLECGAELGPARPSVVKRRKYCSRKCADLARQVFKEGVRTCEWCGAGFEPTRPRHPGELLTRKYCSRKCSGLAQRTFASATMICEECGQEFGPTSGKVGELKGRRFCSPGCALQARTSTIERIIARLVLNPETGCRVWPSYTDEKGYGRTTIGGGKKVLVHRAVWEHLRGPVPEGKQIDHTCGVKACANVRHMRLVTARDNSLVATSNNMAARNFRRLACPKCGGPYSARANGVRYCKPCTHERMMEYQRAYRATKKARD